MHINMKNNIPPNVLPLYIHLFSVWRALNVLISSFRISAFEILCSLLKYILEIDTPTYDLKSYEVDNRIQLAVNTHSVNVQQSFLYYLEHA